MTEGEELEQLQKDENWLAMKSIQTAATLIPHSIDDFSSLTNNEIGEKIQWLATVILKVHSFMVANPGISARDEKERFEHYLKNNPLV